MPISIFTRIIYIILFLFGANSYSLLTDKPVFLTLAILSLAIVNLFPGFLGAKTQKLRVKVVSHGAECLVVFACSSVLSVFLHVFYIVFSPMTLGEVFWSAVWAFCVHLFLFWNGMICVYLSSVQLGIKHRAVGLLLGMIPIANAIMLKKIIKITLSEVRDEEEREERNRERTTMQVCKTKYPCLLVHGVFFRDSKMLNYWGRVPEELKLNGATIFYGEHQSASGIEESAKELSERILRIIKKTNCEKVNIIAHSKGGLDCRYAIAKMGMAPYVASLTTINTPHRGCEFAEYLLDNIPKKTQSKIAKAYNTAARRLGDKKPDFLSAVSDLTAEKCRMLDSMLAAPEGIFCQSVGSVMENASSGKFPLNFSYYLVKRFDGENDGLVSEKAFAFGERYRCLRPTGKRGISHGDMIDLNRENIEGFDVREFYVDLVADLKERGL